MLTSLSLRGANRKGIMMAKTKIKQSPKMPAEHRREQLLDAAGTLFMKKGYLGTTTEEVARKAGLTKGGLYFHFKNKEELLFELVKQMHEELQKNLVFLCMCLILKIYIKNM